MVHEVPAAATAAFSSRADPIHYSAFFVDDFVGEAARDPQCGGACSCGCAGVVERLVAGSLPVGKGVYRTWREPMLSSRASSMISAQLEHSARPAQG